MKFLAMTTLFVSFTSFAACPNLAGVYNTCISSTGTVSSGMSISQTTKNGITTYLITSVDEETNEPQTEAVIANGKTETSTQTDPSSGMTFTQTSKAVCLGNALLINMSLSANGQDLVNLNIKGTKTGNKLTTVTTGSSMGEVINETEVCE